MSAFEYLRLTTAIVCLRVPQTDNFVSMLSPLGASGKYRCFGKSCFECLSRIGSKNKIVALRDSKGRNAAPSSYSFIVINFAAAPDLLVYLCLLGLREKQ